MDARTLRLKSAIVRDGSYVRETRRAYRGLWRKARAMKSKARKLAKADPDSPKAKSIKIQATAVRDAGCDMAYGINDRARRRIDNLAYAFLKGRTYRQCEPKTDTIKALTHDNAGDIAKAAGMDVAVITLWVRQGDVSRKDMTETLQMQTRISKAKGELFELIPEKKRRETAVDDARRFLAYQKADVVKCENGVEQAIQSLAACEAKITAANAKIKELQTELDGLANPDSFTGLKAAFAEAA